MKPDPAAAMSKSQVRTATIEVLESRIAPAVFTVTTLADTSTIAHNSGSLRDALALADAHPGPDTIVFKLPAAPANTINTITLGGTQLMSEGDVSIVGPGPGKLIIDAAGKSRIIDIKDSSPTTDSPSSISGLTMINGSVSGFSGGGVLSYESLKLTNVVISQCNANVAGGLLVIGNPTAHTSVTIKDSTISKNDASVQNGGIHLEGLTSLSIASSIISGNSGTGAVGGLYAALISSGTGMKITNTIISNNSANYSGGAYLDDPNLSPKSKITLSGTKFSQNSADGQNPYGAGGLYLGLGNATISGCQFTNNFANSNGGGMRTGLSTGTLTISNTTFAANTAEYVTGHNYLGGGGLLVDGSGNSTPRSVSISGCHFIANNAQVNEGGGISAVNGVNLTVSSSTFSGNTSVIGSGIWTTGKGLDKVNLTVNGSSFTDNGSGSIVTSGDGSVTMVSSKVSGSTFRSAIDLTSYAGVITLKGVTSTGNMTKLGGAGLHIANSPDFHIIGGSFSGNFCYDQAGGGVAIDVSSGTISGTRITGNITLFKGGGLYLHDSPSVTILHSQIINNIAPTEANISQA